MRTADLFLKGCHVVNNNLLYLQQNFATCTCNKLDNFLSFSSRWILFFFHCAAPATTNLTTTVVSSITFLAATTDMTRLLPRR